MTSQLYIDKASIGHISDITILLALSVFQTIVNSNLPATSDAVPMLGKPYQI